MSLLENLCGLTATGILSICYGLLLLYALSNGRPQDLAEFYSRAPAPIATTTP